MSRPKKIETWTLQAEGIKIEVPVFMNRDNMKFGVSIYQERIWSESLTALKDLAQASFKRQLSIEWLPFIQVYLTHQVQHLTRSADWNDETEKLQQNSNASLGLQVERYWIGRDASGSKCHCELRANEKPGAYGVHSGLPRNPYDYHGSRTNNVLALIPDTPENQAALERITHGFETLIKQLCEVLAPDVIEDTLAQITAGSLRLLEPGEPGS